MTIELLSQTIVKSTSGWVCLSKAVGAIGSNAAGSGDAVGMSFEGPVPE